MELRKLTCEEFTEKLAAKEPVPGGGGVASLVGSIGVALNTMVCNYSIGKKKFLEYSEEHEEIIKEGQRLRERFLDLMEEDAENFIPLSKAYGIKAVTEEEKENKKNVLEKCLKDAVKAPIDTVKCIYDSILLHKKLLPIGSKIMVSDIGVGVQCLKAALYSAELNVLVNINSISDEKYTSEVRTKIHQMVEEGSKMADEIYNEVLNII